MVDEPLEERPHRRSSIAPRFASDAQRVTKFLWRAVDVVLHPLRRRWARRAVAELRSTGSVLFVCSGNLCRSPFAAAVFQRAMLVVSREDLRVASAGFVGIGRQPPPAAVDAAARRFYDLRSHRSKLVDRSIVSAATFIVVMDPGHREALHRRFQKPQNLVVILGDLDPQPIRERAVRDPIGQSASVFEESYDRIERCVNEMVRILAGLG
jgi:protein-tyrosine phosphatase